MLAFGHCFCLMRCFCLFGEPGALWSPHQSARTSSCWTRLSEHLPYERYLLFTLFPSIFFTFSFNPCSGFSASLECKNFCHISRPFQIFRLPIVFLYVHQRCTPPHVSHRPQGFESCEHLHSLCLTRRTRDLQRRLRVCMCLRPRLGHECVRLRQVPSSSGRLFSFHRDTHLSFGGFRSSCRMF